MSKVYISISQYEKRCVYKIKLWRWLISSYRRIISKKYCILKIYKIEQKTQNTKDDFFININYHDQK